MTREFNYLPVDEFSHSDSESAFYSEAVESSPTISVLAYAITGLSALIVGCSVGYWAVGFVAGLFS